MQYTSNVCSDANCKSLHVVVVTDSKQHWSIAAPPLVSWLQAVELFSQCGVARGACPPSTKYQLELLRTCNTLRQCMPPDQSRPPPDQPGQQDPHATQAKLGAFSRTITEVQGRLGRKSAGTCTELDQGFPSKSRWRQTHAPPRSGLAPDAFPKWAPNKNNRSHFPAISHPRTTLLIQLFWHALGRDRLTCE